jgi:hypothetical protein
MLFNGSLSSWENLIDAIVLWVTVGVKKAEKMPVINGCRLAADTKASTTKNCFTAPL